MEITLVLPMAEKVKLNIFLNRIFLTLNQEKISKQKESTFLSILKKVELWEEEKIKFTLEEISSLKEYLKNFYYHILNRKKYKKENGFYDFQGYLEDLFFMEEILNALEEIIQEKTIPKETILIEDIPHQKDTSFI